MGTVACRACKGSGRHYSNSGKTFDCRACGGTGVNRDLWSTRCERCRTEIIYKANSSTPRFCRECRNIQLEKTCSQPGCTNTIRYKVGWDNVATYCKRCETKRADGWSSSICTGTGLFGCGKLVWSPPGKRFNLCPDCSAKKRAADDAKWRTKSCKGCSGEIRYHVDWDKVPDYCKTCNEWQTKTCATCHNQVRYKKYWDNIPNYCPDCQKKQKPRITAGDLFRAGLIPRGWRGEMEATDIKKGHITMIFRGKGTNGKGYRVSWDGFGEPHWTDQGLEDGHPDQHRDPR